MSFFEKVKSFFGEEDEDYLGNQWITLDISLMVPYTELVNIKTALKPYAEELNWKIHSWDDTKDFNEEFGDFGKEIFKEFKDFKKEDFKDKENTRVSVNMYPDGRLTPDEFLKVKEKIVSLVYAMHRDLIYGGDNKKAQKDFRETIHFNYSRTEGHKPKKSDWIVKQSVGFLNIEYPLYKRLNFEKKDKEKALKIFGRSIEEEVKSVFSEKEIKKTKSKTPSKKSKEENKMDKDLEEAHKNMREELRDLFGFNI